MATAAHYWAGLVQGMRRSSTNALREESIKNVSGLAGAYIICREEKNKSF